MIFLFIVMVMLCKLLVLFWCLFFWRGGHPACLGARMQLRYVLDTALTCTLRVHISPFSCSLDVRQDSVSTACCHMTDSSVIALAQDRVESGTENSHSSCILHAFHNQWENANVGQPYATRKFQTFSKLQTTPQSLNELRQDSTLACTSPATFP